MHPFVIPVIVVVLVDVAIVLGAALLRAVVCRDKPLAFHALAIWALVTIFAHAGEELGRGRAVTLLLMVTGTAATLAMSGLGLTDASPRRWLRTARDQRRDIAMVLGVLLVQFAIYLVPLSVFPDRTLVTGNFVVNDSAVHAVLMRGFEVVHHTTPAWDYIGYYPNDFHAVAFALSRLLRYQDVPFFLLPMTMWASSFLGLAVLLMIDGERVPVGKVAVLVAASPAASFLLGTSVYLFFLGHMAALPFVVAVVSIVTGWSAEDVTPASLVLLCALVAAAAGTYGLFSLTLIVFAMAVRVTIELWRPAAPLDVVRRFGRAVAHPRALAGIAFVLVASISTVRQITDGYAFFASQASTVGNLPGGFLSPFLITGFWRRGAEYRAALTGRSQMFLAAILAVQAALVARASLSRASMASLFVFGVPVLASTVFLGSPYVNFKYLCFFTAVWVPLAMLGLARCATQVAGARDWAIAAGLVGVLAIMVLGPLPSFKLLPALPEHWFRTMAAMREQYLSREPFLVLSREDWFQYYRDADDIVPMTIDLTSQYDGRPMGGVLVDDAFRADVVAFLDRTVSGASQRLETCHADVIGARFRLYRFSCLAASQP